MIAWMWWACAGAPMVDDSEGPPTSTEVTGGPVAAECGTVVSLSAFDVPGSQVPLGLAASNEERVFAMASDQAPTGADATRAVRLDASGDVTADHHWTADGPTSLLPVGLDGDGLMMWVGSILGTLEVNPGTPEELRFGAPDRRSLVVLRDSGGGQVVDGAAWTVDSWFEVTGSGVLADGSVVLGLNANGDLGEAWPATPAARSAVVARVGADGRLHWARALCDDAWTWGMAVDPARDELVVGANLSGSQACSLDVRTIPRRDDSVVGLVLRMDADGAVTTAAALHAASVASVAVDADGATYAVGSFEGDATFGVGQADPIHRSGSPVGDAWVGRIEADGTVAWVRRTRSADGQSRSRAAAVAVVGDTVLVAGSYEGQVDVGNPPVATWDLNWKMGQPFLAATDRLGAWTCASVGLIEAQGYYHSQATYIAGIEPLGEGAVSLWGAFDGTAEFFPGTDAATEVRSEWHDVFEMTLGLAPAD